MHTFISAVFVGLILSVQATIYFKDTFEDGDAWKQRWIYSKKPAGTPGDFVLSHGSYYGDEKKDLGLMTSQNARFYTIAANLPKPFNNSKTDFVFQYSVKNTQHLDCGGTYFKLFPTGTALEDIGGNTPYNLMFGPDLCGATNKIHMILTKKAGQTQYPLKKVVAPASDKQTHVYTVVVKSDNTFKVKKDDQVVTEGSLEDDTLFDFLPPKQIKDPAKSKPTDWVDLKEIDDPKDVKPAGWDDIPAKIKDPAATKPTDWSDEEDGVWEAPMIDNPDYKGEWHPKKIPNPAYKGEWVHPMITNPDRHPDPTLYLFEKPLGAIGIEDWQVTSGSIFDNILVTDSETEASDFYKATTGATKDGEKKMLDDIEKKEKEEKEAERKKAEAEAEKKKKEEEATKKVEEEPKKEKDEDL